MTTTIVSHLSWEAGLDMYWGGKDFLVLTFEGNFEKYSQGVNKTPEWTVVESVLDQVDWFRSNTGDPLDEPVLIAKYRAAFAAAGLPVAAIALADYAFVKA